MIFDYLYRLSWDDPVLKNCPLKGLPISIKESVVQKDCDSTFGCITRCFEPSLADELTVEVLHAAGIIPFVR